jgi:hypothetical protein
VSPIYPDESVDGADWIKRGAFDLTASLGIASADELRAWLDAHGTSVEDFKTLPVYRAHLDDVPWLREL